PQTWSPRVARPRFPADRAVGLSTGPDVTTRASAVSLSSGADLTFATHLAAGQRSECQIQSSTSGRNSRVLGNNADITICRTGGLFTLATANTSRFRFVLRAVPSRRGCLARSYP